MKRFFPVVYFLCLCLTGFPQTHNAAFVDGKLYLRLKTADTTFGLTNVYMAALSSLYHMDTCYRPFVGLGNDTLDRTYCLKFSDTAKTDLCIDTLRSLSIVELVEQVPIYHTNYVPNDLNVSQYALIKINAEDAWNISKGSASVVIAIIDNAILTSHQDLAANIVAGYDVADNDNNPDPPSGFTGFAWNHGTHTSGIASAVTDNNVGIASIGFNSKIMPVKCTNDTSKSGGELEFVDEGITYAMQHGAKVMSMSFGSYQSTLTEQILINTAINQGIVMVAAAGNDDSTGQYYPASYTGVISVGATDQNDAKASFSNYGSRIDIVAPGVNIYSTFATTTSSYGNLSGTSMSTPMVAGLTALVFAVNPSFTPAQVLTAIQNGADNINAENPSHTGQLGAGRINAFHALGGTGFGTGIDAAGNVNNMRLYPNPFTGKFIVQLDNYSSSATMQLFDVAGRLILQKDLGNQRSVEIETGSLPAGAYLVKVVGDAGTVSSRMIKM
jgi:serine protease